MNTKVLLKQIKEAHQEIIKIIEDYEQKVKLIKDINTVLDELIKRVGDMEGQLKDVFAISKYQIISDSYKKIAEKIKKG